MLLMLAFSLSIHSQNYNWKKQNKIHSFKTSKGLSLITDRIWNNLFSSENFLKNYFFCSKLGGCGLLFGGGKHIESRFLINICT